MSVRTEVNCFPAKDILDLSSNMLKLSRAMIGGDCFTANDSSPFCFEATYRATLFYAQRYAKGGQEDDFKAFQDTKAALAVGGTRWRAAGKLLRLGARLLLLYTDSL